MIMYDRAVANQDYLATEFWGFCKKAMNYLANDGMSSEESGCEGEGLEKTRVFVVRSMKWRREMSRIWEVVDSHQFNPDCRSPRGSYPVKRVRRYNTTDTGRKPKKGLPRLFYDPTWLGTQGGEYFETVDLQLDGGSDFQWLRDRFPVASFFI